MRLLLFVPRKEWGWTKRESSLWPEKKEKLKMPYSLIPFLEDKQKQVRNQLMNEKSNKTGHI